jgi:general secretion pathway protein C
MVAINGLELSSPEQAIEAYVKLRNAGHLSLAVERAGQRINQEYSIR